MGQRLLLFVHMKRASVGDISGGLGLALLSRAFEPVTGDEWFATRGAQLRRHESIGRVHNDALGILSERIERSRAVHGLLNVRKKFPCSDKLFTQRFHRHSYMH